MEEFKSFLSVRSSVEGALSLLWESSKAFTRGLIISYTASKRHRQAEQRRSLESKLTIVERDYVKNSSSTKLEEISALLSPLEFIRTEEAEGKIRFAKQLEHGVKVGKYLAYPTKKADSNAISSIPDCHGNQSFGTPTNNETFRNFYEGLYTSVLQVNAPELMDSFFSSLDLHSLSDAQIVPISKEDILRAIVVWKGTWMVSLVNFTKSFQTS